MAIGLMVGLGSAAGFNLNLGKKKTEEAKGIAGTAFTSLLLCGILICILVRLFLQPLMMVFGATEDILPYAMEYSGITSFGIPFLLFSTGTNPLVRDKGYVATTTKEIARVAGVNECTLFRKFESKKDIVLQGANQAGWRANVTPEIFENVKWDLQADLKMFMRAYIGLEKVSCQERKWYRR